MPKDERTPEDRDDRSRVRGHRLDGPPAEAPGTGVPQVHPVDGRLREWMVASHPPRDRRDTLR
jgi:hypothetical protein